MWVFTVSHPEYHLLLTKNPNNPLLPGFLLLLVKPLASSFPIIQVVVMANYEHAKISASSL